MAKELDPGILAAMKARLSDRDIEALAKYDAPSRIGLRDEHLEARKALDAKHSKAEHHCRAALFWIRHTVDDSDATGARDELIDKVRELHTLWDAAIEEGGP